MNAYVEVATLPAYELEIRNIDSQVEFKRLKSLGEIRLRMYDIKNAENWILLEVPVKVVMDSIEVDDVEMPVPAVRMDMSKAVVVEDSNLDDITTDSVFSLTERQISCFEGTLEDHAEYHEWVWLQLEKERAEACDY